MTKPFPNLEVENDVLLGKYEWINLGFKYINTEINEVFPNTADPGYSYFRWTYKFSLGSLTLKIGITYPDYFVDCYINKDSLWFSFEDYLKSQGASNEIYDSFHKNYPNESERNDINYIKAFLMVLDQHCATDPLFRDVLLGKKWVHVPRDLGGYK